MAWRPIKRIKGWLAKRAEARQEHKFQKKVKRYKKKTLKAYRKKGNELAAKIKSEPKVQDELRHWEQVRLLNKIGERKTKGESISEALAGTRANYIDLLSIKGNKVSPEEVAKALLKIERLEKMMKDKAEAKALEERLEEQETVLKARQYMKRKYEQEALRIESVLDKKKYRENFEGWKEKRLFDKARKLAKSYRPNAGKVLEALIGQYWRNVELNREKYKKTGNRAFGEGLSVNLLKLRHLFSIYDKYGLLQKFGRKIGTNK